MEFDAKMHIIFINMNELTNNEKSIAQNEFK